MDDDGIVAEINMTPLIDIMLVLLILFMVTSSLSLESGLSLELPQVEEVSQNTSEGAVIVSLGHGGGLLVQGKKVAPQNLREEIAQALQAAPDGVVILEGDKNASLGRAVEIMDIAKSAGASSFMIAAEERPSE